MVGTGTGSRKGIQDAANEGRERLIEAAMRLFTERNYTDVAIHEIAEAAGMTRSAPYYHFRNKEDLYVAVVHRQLLSLFDRIREELAAAGSFRAELGAIVNVAVEMTSTPYGRFISDFHHHISPEQQRLIMDDVPSPQEIYLPVFEAAHARGEFHRTTPEAATQIFFMLLIGYTESCHKEARFMLPGKNPVAASQLLDVFLNGI
jgi:AcrR family transcriptional regulator